jgi:hypothetical protein
MRFQVGESAASVAGAIVVAVNANDCRTWTRRDPAPSSVTSSQPDPDAIRSLPSLWLAWRCDRVWRERDVVA